MQVIIHAGAHMTDEDRLLKCLLGNEPVLSELGTVVPHPSLYRKHMRDLINKAAQGTIAPDVRAAVMGFLKLSETPERLILSSDRFFGTPRMAVTTDQFYPPATTRLSILQQVFAGDRVELCFAIRNPASFLPVMAKECGFATVSQYLGGGDARNMRWSEMFTRLRAECPEVPITVWCNEDTPLIWSEVLREFAGVEPTIHMDGEYLLLREIMTPAGIQRFLSYMDSHPDMTEMQKRRVIAAFLDKFADEDVIEEELDMPGWTEELVDQLTDAYDEDVFALSRIPGVTLISP